MVKYLLDDKLRASLHSVPSGTSQLVYNGVEELMLDLLHNDVIGEPLKDNIAKDFDTDTGAGRV